MGNHCSKKRSIHFRMTTDEFLSLEKRRKNSTISDRSEYIRYVLLNKPITMLTRNQSLDDLIGEVIALRKQFTMIVGIYNHMAEKLPGVESSEEVRSLLQGFDQDKSDLLRTLEEIKLKMNVIADAWFQ
ncbi:MAG: plasmid mobilization protein [Sphingobacteriales bacterium]